MEYKDLFITDFTSPDFTRAFKVYFAELGITVKEWDKLFCEMNSDANTFAFLRTDKSGEVIGFIMFSPIPFSSWFFETNLGFIREFWIAGSRRSQGHGSQLLNKAENYFVERGIYKTILTTHTADSFYLKHGYLKDAYISAKNQNDVYIKNLRQAL